ncbi:hypothetical protein B296_00023683 [Ensete ventricosum]|uniref:Aspartic peptidase DDI1-type domain-containing protein n=1 Tax=Ensete ventricosum TaxID=4639 RepID=A0A427AW40_ENSVE|nr:hypothetical protein B296_00023683 [Ensete ventricosum]
MGETEYPDHNDALVVLVCIANAKVKRIMIDIGSSINVLYFDAFHKLGLTTIDLSPMSSTLIGFTGDFIAPLGMIILPVIIEQEPRSKTMMVTFMVVNFSSAYNIILSRSILNKFRELHLSSGDEVLDPSKIKKVRSNPRESKQWYLTTITLLKKLKSDHSTLKKVEQLQSLSNQPLIDP